jgi:hypothetical protein
VVPGFLEHVQLKEWAELVDDFDTATDAVVTIVDVEGVIHSDGREP